MTPKEARKILNESAESMSDEEVHKAIADLEELANILFDEYMRKKKTKELQI